MEKIESADADKEPGDQITTPGERSENRARLKLE
jgi:hypothetical protein